MVVNLVQHILDDASSGTRAIVVLDNWASAGLFSRANGLKSGEALNTHATAESLVLFLIAIDGSDFGVAFQLLGSLLESGLEVLAVAAPRSVELDNLYRCEYESLLVKARGKGDTYGCVIGVSNQALV
jgi:hypothetical protein